MAPDKEKRTWYRKRIDDKYLPTKEWWLRETLYQRRHAPDVPIEDIHLKIINK